MKYSFIVPIYNVEKYLRRCVNSLLAQTFSDYQIILVDDGSTDSSGFMADEYAQNYSDKVQVIHQKNAGLGGARNTGIEAAEGEYLVMVDSDDYISERMLETVDRYLVQYQNDILIFDFIMEEEEGGQTVQHLHGKTPYMQITNRQFLQETPAAWNKVYKASLFKDTDVRYPGRIYYEDIATSPCLGIYASNIGVISEPLYYYIQRECSIIHTKNTKRMTEICAAVKITLEYFKTQGKFEEYKSELEWMTVQHVLCSGVQRILLVQYDREKVHDLYQFVEGYFPEYLKNAYIKEYLAEPGHKRETRIIKKQRWLLFAESVVKRPFRIAKRMGKQ